MLCPVPKPPFSSPQRNWHCLPGGGARVPSLAAAVSCWPLPSGLAVSTRYKVSGSGGCSRAPSGRPMASPVPLYTTIQAESSICVPPFSSVWVKGSLQRLDVKAEVLLHQVKVGVHAGVALKPAALPTASGTAPPRRQSACAWQGFRPARGSCSRSGTAGQRG